MCLWEKQILFSEHAFERSLEWQFPRGKIKEALNCGFICPNKEPNKNQCIYKFQNQYFTIIFCEYAKVVVIITVYHSGPLEIKKAEKGGVK